jgi:RES domain-containing protein
LTPLPAALGGTALVAWRLDRADYAAAWQQAEGAFLFGGRWSPPGRRVIYAALDPATAILEVAVHKGFDALDTVPHTLSCLDIGDPRAVHVVEPHAVPNRNWLVPGTVSANQQAFGDALLARHPLVVIPSVVSRHSWNLLIDADGARDRVSLQHAEAFALDTRLTPAVHAGKR